MLKHNLLLKLRPIDGSARLPGAAFEVGVVVEIVFGRTFGFDSDQLCQACITGEYPTPAGRQLYQIALKNGGGTVERRTYEDPAPEAAAVPR